MRQTRNPQHMFGEARTPDIRLDAGPRNVCQPCSSDFNTSVATRISASDYSSCWAGTFARPGDDDTRGQCMGGESQRIGQTGELAVQDRERTDQAEVAVSINSMKLGY